ncbi:MAG: adenylate/guanylate cyclase domain-containing protein [Burkholderiales bacterium]
MTESAPTRKLAAILGADVTGYSRLMAQDDAGTVRALEESRAVFRERIEAHGGSVIDMAGDSVLAQFPSALEAVHCAMEVQKAFAGTNAFVPSEKRMLFRIGLNIGDILQQPDGTIYGDGVNIAARLESIAEPGGITISGAVYDQVKSRLEANFEFTGEQTVKNIPEPVRTYRVVMGGSVAKPAAARGSRRMVVGIAVIIIVAATGSIVWWMGRPATHPARGKGEPVVAVLAFANMSADPKQEYFSDGLTENIIDSLAQVRDLKVIARNSSFRYKGQAVDVRKAGEELGASYIVEGSVRRAAKTLRVTAQLVETKSGSHLWSKTFDRELTAENVFAIEDEVATGIVNAMSGTFGVLRQVGLEAAKRKAPRELSSYECVLLGMEHERALSLQTFRPARDCLEEAVKVDPDYAAGWAYLSWIYRSEYIYGYDSRPGSLDLAIEAARRAVALAPDHAYNHSSLALAHFSRGDLAEFKAEAERAIALSPKGSTAIGLLGVYLCYAGEWDKSLALIAQAKALDPYPPAWYNHPEFHDHYRKGNYSEALKAAQKGDLAESALTQSLTVAVYGALGRAEEATLYVKRIRELDPSFEEKAREHWYKRFRFQPEYLERFLDGMRKGGLKIPEKSS